jgi:serine/threonine-protein kinase
MIGQTISHYKILEKLGEGGMGVVFKAQDTKLDRPVALKFFPPELCGDLEHKTRFIQEAKIASSIDHPNVVAIYEIDEVENNNLFIAMAYYRGETLDRKIRVGALNLREAVDIALQISRGLAKSHEMGIVHQDIKPSNILISEDGTAKILDFGVATLNESAGKYRTEGSIAGTLLYMSPEQVRGDITDLRTDIWSLGVVFYEMISGRSPFSREYEQSIQYSIMNEQQAPIEDLPTTISADVLAMIDRALQKNPGRRFQGMDEIISCLETIQKKIDSTSVEQKPAIAVLPFADLSPQRDQEYFCDGLTEELINVLGEVGELRVTSRSSSFQFKGKAEDVRQIGERLNVNIVLEGSVRKSGEHIRISAQLIDVASGFQLWSERFDRRLVDIFSIQEEIAHMIVQTLKIKLMPEESRRLVKRSTENPDAFNLYLEGRYHWNKRTGESLKKAIEFFEKAIKIDPRYALAYSGVADSYALLDQYGSLPIRESYERARAAAVKALELDDRLAEAHASFAEVELWYNWDWVGGEQKFRQAIVLNPNYATAHHWLSISLNMLGRFDESFVEINRALELDPLSLIIIRDKGVNFYYARQYDNAILQARRVLDMDPGFALAHRLLAIACERKGMYAESLAENRIWGDLTNDHIRTQAAFGHVYAVSGRKDDAVEVLRQLEKQIVARKDLAYATALIYTGLGQTDQAFGWFDKAYECRSATLGAIKVDPKLDDLRSDPRFDALLRKMKLQ